MPRLRLTTRLIATSGFYHFTITDCAYGLAARTGDRERNDIYARLPPNRRASSFCPDRDTEENCFSSYLPLLAYEGLNSFSNREAESRALGI